MKSFNSIKQSAKVILNTVKSLRASADEKSEIHQIKQDWLNKFFSQINLNLQVIGSPLLDKKVLFVGNHISYLDIPVVMATVPLVSFVAKKEIGAWPVFGSAAKKIDTIFVSRNDKTSRGNARDEIRLALDRGARIAVFPSGTTSLDESKPWRKGSLQVAMEVGARVQGFRIQYQQLRKVAYIDNDFFPTHLCRLFNEKCIDATIEFSNEFYVQDPIADSARMQQWSQGVYRGQNVNQ